MQQSLFPLDDITDTFDEATQLETDKIVNVASVPFRSPFRYAGGKTWLIPRIRQWLTWHGGADRTLFEVFAGGGIVSLSAVFESLVGQATMVEMDDDVAAVWQVILQGDASWLANEIMSFELTESNAREAIARAGLSLRCRAFATIVKNRINRGGILAEGASFVKHGENGKGIQSRWYPSTLKRRILEIDRVRTKIRFIHGDGLRVLEKRAFQSDAVWFIDPPYVKAGRRLYNCSDVDHAALFARVAELKGSFLMTYDNAPEIRELARKHRFVIEAVAMKNTHHAKKSELLIGRDLTWLSA